MDLFLNFIFVRVFFDIKKIFVFIDWLFEILSGDNGEILLGISDLL